MWGESSYDCQNCWISRMGKAMGSYPRSWMENSAGFEEAEQGHELSWKGEQPCHLCDTENSLKEETLLYHILTRHYHELHLKQESLLDSSRLMVMPGDLHLDILSKFKGVFHHYLSLISFCDFDFCVPYSHELIRWTFELGTWNHPF